MILGLDQITFRELKSSQDLLRLNEVSRRFERDIPAFLDWKARQPNV